MTIAAQPTYSQPLTAWISRAYTAATRLPPAPADLAAVVVIWLVACLPWLIGRRFIPYDSVDAFYPESHFVVSSLLRGEMPWWNPYIFGGQPTLGDPQSMIFTPHTLVGLIAGNGFNLHVFDVTTLACLLFGGVAIQRYGSAYATSRVLPILGAAVFMLGGVATSRLQHVPQIISYALLPIQLLLVRTICLKPNILAGIALVGVVAMALVNPNQVTFLSVFALAPFLALHLQQAPRPGYAALVIGSACVAALIVASPVLSAIAEFLAESNRPILPLLASQSASFPFSNLASLFLPGLYGVLRPADTLWPPTDATQDYLYIGVIPTVIMVMSLLRNRRQGLMSALCLGLAVFWFMFALGTNGTLYPILFAHLPGFASFRRPADGAFLLNLMLALFICCSTGIEPGRLRPKLGASIAGLLLVAFGVACALLCVRAAQTGNVSGLVHTAISFGTRLAILLPLVLLYSSEHRFRLRGAIGLLLLSAAVIDLGTAGRFGRIYAPRYASSEAATLYSTSPSRQATISSLLHTLQFLRDQQKADGPDAFRIEVLGGDLAGTMPTVFGLSVLQGNNPAVLGNYASMIGHQNLQNDEKLFTSSASGYDADLYQHLGLKYVLLNRTILKSGKDFGAFGSKLQSIESTFAKSSFAYRVENSGDYEIWRLNQAATRISLEPSGVPQTDNARADIGSCSGNVSKNAQVVTTCRSGQPTLLVFAENYAPGWFACVNDRPVEIARYHGLLQTLSLSAGESRVEFRFEPTPFWRRSPC